MKLINVVHLDLERFPALQGCRFQGLVLGWLQVLAEVKSLAVVPKGSSVSTAKVQVSRPAGMQISKLDSGVGPGCWLELRARLWSLKETAFQLPRWRFPGPQACRFPGLIPGWFQGVGCS